MLHEETDIQSPETQEQPVDQSIALREQLLRTTADFDNFRKRTERERVEWMNVTRVTLLKKILPLFDDVERALSSLPAKETTTDASLVAAIDGFSLISKNFSKVLSDLGVMEISANGTFDPELHEALMQVDGNGAAASTIMQVFEKGYKLGDTVIRHSKVSVAK